MTERIEKPWGYELILERNAEFVVKEILLRAGEQSSLQVHGRKREWVRVESGILDLVLGAEADALETCRLTAGATYRVAPGTIHRVVAIEDVVILEVATPGDDDIVRLDDQYGRT